MISLTGIVDGVRSFFGGRERTGEAKEGKGEETPELSYEERIAERFLQSRYFFYEFRHDIIRGREFNSFQRANFYENIERQVGREPKLFNPCVFEVILIRVLGDRDACARLGLSYVDYVKSREDIRAGILFFYEDLLKTAPEDPLLG